MKKYEQPKIELIKFCYSEVAAESISDPYIEPDTEPYNPFGFTLTAPAPAAEEAAESWIPSDDGGGGGDVFSGSSDDGGGDISSSDVIDGF